MKEMLRMQSGSMIVLNFADLELPLNSPKIVPRVTMIVVVIVVTVLAHVLGIAIIAVVGVDLGQGLDLRVVVMNVREVHRIGSRLVDCLQVPIGKI